MRHRRRRYAPPASLECLRRYIAADFAQYAAMAKETVLENRIQLVESKQKASADRVASTEKRIEDLRGELLRGSSIAVSTVDELKRVDELIRVPVIVAPSVSAKTRDELVKLAKGLRVRLV
ncbi:uncharacterized protein LOC132303865 [Cornus florida]|uniref:uncharacterized protein LOC132303865 n=1 Tax=Cornus florida TaxID=4283 RepID=UPI0028A05DB3|nr:uncharacterized protein LOC132303865 [Cornus florida]